MPAGLTGRGEYGELPALASEAFLSGAARRRGGTATARPTEEGGTFREAALCRDFAELGCDEPSATESQILRQLFDEVAGIRTLRPGMIDYIILIVDTILYMCVYIYRHLLHSCQRNLATGLISLHG